MKCWINLFRSLASLRLLSLKSALVSYRLWISPWVLCWGGSWVLTPVGVPMHILRTAASLLVWPTADWNSMLTGWWMLSFYLSQLCRWLAIVGGVASSLQILLPWKSNSYLGCIMEFAYNRIERFLMVLELSFSYVFTRDEVSTFVFIILSWC